ncbi:DUF5711 family protein [Thermohalobacter berrensis]|uniref:Pyrrolo-quinoline quinone n=1 Tax=Thermohalobacter berrensis TaxID=99594 RepID=A0A419T3S2_9FIRM|nr:DUF5711 family protein [Thermohalobacter berrensis]RKD32063.1 hypothetical protein BET03_11320 [Thermohalobacter berrensis]
MTRKNNDNKNKIKVGRFILLFIMLILLFSNDIFKEKIHGIFETEKTTLKVNSKKNISLENNSKVKIYGDRFIIYRKNKLICYDMKGIKMWDKTIKYNNPLIYFGEKRLYIADSTMGNVLALNSNGKELWNYSFKLTVEQILEKKGFLLAFTKAGEELDGINVLNSDGKLVSNIIIEKGKILYGNINDNKKNIAITTLSTEEGQLESYLMLYSFIGKEIWEKKFENQILQNVEFIDEDTIVLVSDEEVACVKEKKLLWARDLEGTLLDIVIDKKDKRIMFLWEEDGKYFETVSFKGRTLEKKRVDKEYEYLYYNNGETFLIGEKKIKGIKKGKAFLNFNSDEEIKYFGFIEDKAVIFTQNNVKIMDIVSIKSQ